MTDTHSAAYWTARLAEHATRHRVPGAVLGVLRADGNGDGTVEAAHGVLNTATGVAATTDSLFQIGSMTKVWTATLVMQLVDEGRLDLDRPVVDLLPELRFADERATATVTTRHLLTHTSGIDGDVFTDTGRGDDCLERYVAGLAAVPQVHPPGATWSYCNSGFVVVGRLVERLTGSTWDEALRDRLVRPLGLTRTVTLPEEALLHRAAVGHVGPPGAEPRPAPVWAPVRSMGPAGLVTSTAHDVLAFARMHLSGGLAADGTRVLSEAAVTAMQEHHADLPGAYTLGDSCGLAWFRLCWDGHRLVGHDGNTIGQSAFLRLLPAQGLAVTLLTNGGYARELFEDLVGEVLGEFAGVTVPGRVQPPRQPPPVDPRAYVGTYARTGVRCEVSERDGSLVLRVTSDAVLAGPAEERSTELPLVPVRPGLFVTREPGAGSWSTVTFYPLADGTPYLHLNARAVRRVVAPGRREPAEVGP